MNLANPLNFWPCLLLFQMVTGALLAIPSHREQIDDAIAIVSRYRLIDLFTTDLDLSQLAHLPDRLSLAPRMSNAGQAIINRIQGGIVCVPLQWEYSPRMEGLTISMHAINDCGDLIVGLVRGGHSLEWMLWPGQEEEGYNSVRQHIYTVDLFEEDCVLSDFNNAGMVVGHFKKCHSRPRPFIWMADRGFCRLGAKEGLEIYGEMRHVNEAGAVAGVIDEVSDQAPFYWSDRTGLEVLRTYRNLLEPKGWVEFADMVLLNDDTIYGTFWIRHLHNNRRPHPSTPHFAYSWQPRSGKVEMLDLQGMRIAAANANHLLVGSKEGKAAICEQGRPAMALADLIDPEQLRDWELIEATTVNDRGQILGYGKYRSELHIFLADPLM